MSLLIPILMVLGMGCVVREPTYTTGYVAYGSPDYIYYDDVYLSDGYYWAFYGDSWYWWSHDHWVYSTYRPRSPVVISNYGGHGGHGGRPPGVSGGGMVTRDHRDRGGYHDHGDHRGYRAPAPSTDTQPQRSTRIPRSAPPPRGAPSRMTTRDHRR